MFFKFEEVAGSDELVLAKQVIQLAKERCFDLNLVDPAES